MGSLTLAPSLDEWTPTQLPDMRVHTFSVLAFALIAALEPSEAKPQWINALPQLIQPPQAYVHGYGLPACGVNGLPYVYCMVPEVLPPSTNPPSTNSPFPFGGNYGQIYVLYRLGANRKRVQ